MKDFTDNKPSGSVNKEHQRHQPQNYRDTGYFSLSQFEVELQRQTQLSRQQEPGMWRGFENHLSHESQLDFQQYFPLPPLPNARPRPIVDLVTNRDLPLTGAVDSGVQNMITSATASTSAFTNSSTTGWSPVSISDVKREYNCSEHIPLIHTNRSLQSSTNFLGSLTSIEAIQKRVQSPKERFLRNNSFSSQTIVQSPKENIVFTTPSTININHLQLPQQRKTEIASSIHFGATDNSNQSIITAPVINTSCHSNNIDSIISTPSSINNHASPSKLPQKKKASHSVIERRYRDNINDRITELKDAVPALLYAKVRDSQTGTKRAHSATYDGDNEDENGEEYIDGVAVATKLNKATVLHKATEYILHLKRTNEDTLQENVILQHLLNQLPGGREILARYHMQKAQCEQEISHERSQEKIMQKRKQHENSSYRKKTRHSQKTTAHEEASSENSSVGDPSTPPMQPPQAPTTTTTVNNRVFMALFMAVSFFSSSPLSAGPVSKEQFESHNHIGRTADNLTGVLNSNDNSSLFPLDGIWSLILSTMFVVCIIQLILPVFKFWFSYSFFKAKHFTSCSKTKLNGNSHSHIDVNYFTPGDKKCIHIYNILVESLQKDATSIGPTVFPQKQCSTLGFYIALFKEIARFVSRHWLGYEIFYTDQDRLPQEQWIQACRWIKLNEIECLGGNPAVTRSSMLYSCFHALNLIEIIEEDENKHAGKSRSRVYATAALQMALVVPHANLAKKLSRYFWRLAMYELDLDNDPLMRTLIANFHEDGGEVMLNSCAWRETLEVMNQQVACFGGDTDSNCRLSLSMTTPVLFPVGILSTLHLLDNLQIQFNRLIISVTAASQEEQGKFSYETAFTQLLEITSPVGNQADDYHCLVRWFAAVGTVVNALWKFDTKSASDNIQILIEKNPHSLISRKSFASDIDLVRHKDLTNQLDELKKKYIVHTLIGATLLKKLDNTDQQCQGIEELTRAEKTKAQIKKIVSKNYNRVKKQNHDLESSVLALAEFVVAVAGLEAWIGAWHLAPSLQTDGKDYEVSENTITERIQHASLDIRRMINHHSLHGLKTNQTMVERLSRLGTYVSSQVDDTDSACECSSDSEDNEQQHTPSNKKKHKNNALRRRSKKALDILHGLS